MVPKSQHNCLYFFAKVCLSVSLAWWTKKIPSTNFNNLVVNFCSRKSSPVWKLSQGIISTQKGHHFENDPTKVTNNLTWLTYSVPIHTVTSVRFPAKLVAAKCKVLVVYPSNFLSEQYYLRGKTTAFTKIIFYTETFTCQPLNIVPDKQFKGNYSDFYRVNFNVSINLLCSDLEGTRLDLTQSKMWTSKYSWQIHQLREEKLTKTISKLPLHQRIFKKFYLELTKKGAGFFFSFFPWITSWLNQVNLVGCSDHR